MSRLISEGQGVLQPPQDMAQLLRARQGIVHLEDLTWSQFDPEHPLTMAQYIGEIGSRMTETPRQSITTDRDLHLFRNDFQMVQPRLVESSLYMRPGHGRSRPGKKMVWVATLDGEVDETLYPGVVSPSTGVAVYEELYDAIIGNPAFYGNRSANRTQKKNSDELSIEECEDLGDESAVYGAVERHVNLEEHDAFLLEQRGQLTAVYKNILAPKPRRIVNLEPYRLAATQAIQTMLLISAAERGYGTNDTENALAAAASNIYRSFDPGSMLREYLRVAINHNDAMRGKIVASIKGLMDVIGFRREGLINNIDREYDNKPRKRASAPKAA